MALVLTTWMIGCLAAIPTGPIQVQVLKKALNGHILTALIIIATAAAVDMAYGAAALLGLAPMLTNHTVTTAFWSAGGLILLLIGTLTATRPDTQPKPGKTTAAFTALLLSATNPVMLLWWLATTKMLTDMKLLTTLNTSSATTIILAGTAGMCTYLFAIAMATYKVKRFIGDLALRRIQRAFGCLLVCMGIYFLSTALRQL